jgi:mannose-6-phosphate isomerase-like protein (cupin superfamily)
VQVLPGGCRVIGSDEGETLTDENCRSRKLISRKCGARQIAQTINEYATGRSPTMVNPQAEEVLYAVSGRGICHIGGIEYKLQAGVGAYIPPAIPYSVENRGPEKLIVVSVCCPEDDQRHIVKESQMGAHGGTDAQRRIVHENDRQAIPVADRRFKLLVDKDVGCERVTQFIGFIPPSKAPFHYHTYEEAIFILEGRGIAHVEGGSCEFGPGTSIYLPVGLRHCLENPGPEAVRLLGVFYPSGSPAVAYEK